MTTKTMGTNSNHALVTIQAAPANQASIFTSVQSLSPGNFSNWSAADFATMSNSIRDDKSPSHNIIPGSITKGGLLYVPNRGVLKIYPGDWVGVDNNGWPILVAAYAMDPPTGVSSWVHN